MPHPAEHWRVITTPPAQGAWNMAVDEAILEAVSKGLEPTTVRLYAWEPACLSLGYAQPINDADLPKLSSLGWDIVRRPTGGRAILHTDELTYSVIGLLTEPQLSGGVLESYQRISQALLMALELMGIQAIADAHPELPTNSDPKGPICFEVPSSYEITVDGKKVIGSAQARKQGVLLQHGSLPLQGDLRRITQALVFSNEAEREVAGERLLKRATTVEEILGRALPWEKAAQAFIQAFEQSLDINLDLSRLSDEETSRAEELRKNKYGHNSWTART